MKTMKICSFALVIRETQIKTTMKYCYTSDLFALVIKFDNPKY